MATEKTRNPNNYLKLLTDRGVISEGTTLYLKHNLPSNVSYDANDPRFRGSVVMETKGTPKIKWDHDGNTYSGTKLKARILSDVRGKEVRAGRPYISWGTESENLVEMAERLNLTGKVS